MSQFPRRPTIGRTWRGFLLFGSVSAILSSGAGAVVGAGEPTLFVEDRTVTEGNSGEVPAVFTVSLSAPATSPVTVDFVTSDGTAAAPGDYAATSGTLSFAVGETTKTFTVAVRGDTLDEAHETYSVELSNPTNATLADGHAGGAILDDDPSPSVSIDDVTVSEGDGNATFTVSLSAQSGRVVAVKYETADGEAAAPADYTAATGTLFFSVGETSKPVTVPVVNDGLDELDETLLVKLFFPVNVTLADGQGVGTIKDDDEPVVTDPPPTEPPPTEPPPVEPPPTEPPPVEPPPSEPPVVENAAPDCSGVRASSAYLWPPNHKFRLVSLGGATDPDGDAPALVVTGVTQDEPVRSKGDKGPDAQWAASKHAVYLRAERRGAGNGRVYRIAYEVTDGTGGACSGVATVAVPHDRSRAAADSGSVFDSFGS